MKEQFVTYEIALILKEKGFDELTFGFYWMDTKQLVYDSPYTGKHHGVHLQAPLWQQVIDWFLIEHEIYIYIARDGGWWIVNIKDLSREEDEGAIDIELKGHFSNCFDELPKARQAAIEHALTLI